MSPSPKLSKLLKSSSLDELDEIAEEKPSISIIGLVEEAVQEHR